MKVSKLIIWTVVLNFLILIAAGHGGGFIGLGEIFWFPYIQFEEFTLSPLSSYDNSLQAVALFCCVGQIILIGSLFLKNYKVQSILIYTGLIILWIGFYYLTHTMFKDELARISFFSGLPFLIVSIILAIKVRRVNSK